MTENILPETNQQNTSSYEPLINYNSPIYDPFSEPKDDDLFPDNEEALQILHISYIFRDIRTLCDIFGRSKKSQDKRLLWKYIIIEWVSLDENLIKFANSLIAKKTQIICSDQEIEELKRLKKEYEQARKPHKEKLETIRNKLAAHRELLHFADMANLWQSINYEELIDILNAAVHFFNFAKDLNIYSFLKVQDTSEGEMLALIDPALCLYDESES
ncbi:MAG: hypothetical protein ACK5WC_18405 [Aphanizomenon sp.]|jgi:uncharacterized protein VirK/YbjX